MKQSTAPAPSRANAAVAGNEGNSPRPAEQGIPRVDTAATILKNVLLILTLAEEHTRTAFRTIPEGGVLLLRREAADVTNLIGLAIQKITSAQVREQINAEPSLSLELAEMTRTNRELAARNGELDLAYAVPRQSAPAFRREGR